MIPLAERYVWIGIILQPVVKSKKQYQETSTKSRKSACLFVHFWHGLFVMSNYFSASEVSSFAKCRRRPASA